MATKLTTITGNYHSYVEDQVLTHFQLNETIDFFDDQNRIQNVFLTGTGIACGFKVSTNADYDRVVISLGTAITTDGDILKLKKPVVNEVSEALKQKLFSLDFAGNNVTFKTFKPFDTDKGEYAHFDNGSGGLLSLSELLPEKDSGAPTEAGELPLTDYANLKDAVVLLYLEHYTKDASLCNTIDCSNQGGEEVFNLRVLLASKTVADTIIGRDALYSKYNLYDTYTQVPELGIKKVIPTYLNTQTTLKVKQLFYTVVNDTVFKTDLKDGFTDMMTAFGFASEATLLTNGINTLTTIASNAIPTDIHYRYDMLKDLLSTYGEMKNLFIQIKAECHPPVAAFPKHIMLGLVEENEYYKSYRHGFYPSPILEGNNPLYAQFANLVQRAVGLVSTYVIPAGNVKITPSKVAGDLGEKAVPYYYSVTLPLLYSWNFDKSKIYKHRTPFSYHTVNLVSDDCIVNPLRYNLDNYDFYRVEGYLGNDPDTVREQLLTLRSLHGLDFEISVLDIIEDAETIKYLLTNYPAFEHKAGVKKGGTLLLLKDGTNLLTDFAVDYPVQLDPGLGCCTISQCQYPWISTLKYLNNLSRSLLGTQSFIKAMPTHYAINVRKYSINGVNLITAPVVVRVPLNSDVFLRRMHAITEALNNRFPTGLVFDFDETKKKLKILKLEKDKFEFEVQDITMATNTPVYKYTEAGVTRNGKNFMGSAITCTILNSHNESIYKKIHSNYAPVDKDDDYGAFNEDWRKWETLRRRLINHSLITEFGYQRFITEFNQFENIHSNHPNKFVLNELVEIATAIKNADSRFTNIYIGGDWTNGNWVNGKMHDYYVQHQNNTNDDLVLFVKLRRKLHAETNTSKYMIHIDTLVNVNAASLANVMSFYAKKAEFYFQKPTNGNFIKIPI